MIATAALEYLRTLYNVDAVFEGRCPGGEVGAYFARRTDGTRFVFKWSDDLNDLHFYESMVDLVNRLRLLGYPIPEYDRPYLVPEGVVVLQSAVGGAWRDTVDHALLDEVVALNALQVAQLPDAKWEQLIRKSLTTGLDGYCQHESLAEYGRDTQKLLQVIRQIGEEKTELPSGDVVHFDFHHRNLLRSADQLTAVIDWEGCRVGDQIFDLVTFAFGLTAAKVEPGVEDRLWSFINEHSESSTVRAYVAHMALRQVDWSIRFHGGVGVDELLEIVRRRI